MTMVSSSSTEASDLSRFVAHPVSLHGCGYHDQCLILKIAITWLHGEEWLSLKQVQSGVNILVLSYYNLQSADVRGASTLISFRLQERQPNILNENFELMRCHSVSPLSLQNRVLSSVELVIAKCYGIH